MCVCISVCVCLSIYICVCVCVNISVCVTWSTTERREIRNFPYPSMFELTGHQRLTIKRGIRNIGQFLVAEVTNPGQNESQEMLHSVTGLIKKGV